jgi:hypothetical protein
MGFHIFSTHKLTSHHVFPRQKTYTIKDRKGPAAGRLKSKAYPMPHMSCDMEHKFLANGQYNEDVKIYKRFFRGREYMGNGTFLEIGE